MCLCLVCLICYVVCLSLFWFSFVLLCCVMFMCSLLFVGLRCSLSFAVMVYLALLLLLLCLCVCFCVLICLLVFRCFLQFSFVCVVVFSVCAFVLFV